jgi:hypothetical protein
MGLLLLLFLMARFAVPAERLWTDMKGRNPTVTEGATEPDETSSAAGLWALNVELWTSDLGLSLITFTYYLHF